MFGLSVTVVIFVLGTLVVCGLIVVVVGILIGGTVWADDLFDLDDLEDLDDFFLVADNESSNWDTKKQESSISRWFVEQKKLKYF